METERSVNFSKNIFKAFPQVVIPRYLECPNGPRVPMGPGLPYNFVVINTRWGHQMVFALLVGTSHILISVGSVF